MIETLLAAAIVSASIIGVTIGVTIFWDRRSGRILRSRHGRNFIVTLKSDQAFSGVLFDSDPDALVLRQAEAINRGVENLIVDGELVVLRAEIDTLQRV